MGEWQIAARRFGASLRVLGVESGAVRAHVGCVECCFGCLSRAECVVLSSSSSCAQEAVYPPSLSNASQPQSQLALTWRVPQSKGESYAVVIKILILRPSVVTFVPIRGQECCTDECRDLFARARVCAWEGKAGGFVGDPVVYLCAGKVPRFGLGRGRGMGGS